MKLKKSYSHKTPIFLKDIDIEKVLVSNNISFGEKICKYFIGYMYIDNKSKPLHIMLTKTSTFVKGYDGQTKWICFLIEYDDLVELELKLCIFFHHIITRASLYI